MIAAAASRNSSAAVASGTGAPTAISAPPNGAPTMEMVALRTCRLATAPGNCDLVRIRRKTATSAGPTTEESAPRMSADPARTVARYDTERAVAVVAVPATSAATAPVANKTLRRSYASMRGPNKTPPRMKPTLEHAPVIPATSGAPVAAMTSKGNAKITVREPNAAAVLPAMSSKYAGVRASEAMVHAMSHEPRLSRIRAQLKLRISSTETSPPQAPRSTTGSPTCQDMAHVHAAMPKPSTLTQLPKERTRVSRQPPGAGTPCRRSSDSLREVAVCGARTSHKLPSKGAARPTFGMGLRMSAQPPQQQPPAGDPEGRGPPLIGQSSATADFVPGGGFEIELGLDGGGVQ